MVSRAIEQHSELKQNLFCILNNIYPEMRSSFLDNFAEELANLALENQSPDEFKNCSLWSANDVLLISYPDNIISQNTPPLQSLQKFLAEYFILLLSL